MLLVAMERWRNKIILYLLYHLYAAEYDARLIDDFCVYCLQTDFQSELHKLYLVLSLSNRLDFQLIDDTMLHQEGDCRPPLNEDLTP